MTLPIILRLHAQAEFVDAADYYEQKAGMGAQFTAAVRRVLNEIARSPNRYPIVRGDIREAVVPGFPYCVYYRVRPDRIIVIAVFHTSRDPADWQSRQ